MLVNTPKIVIFAFLKTLFYPNEIYDYLFFGIYVKKYTDEKRKTSKSLKGYFEKNTIFFLFSIGYIL